MDLSWVFIISIPLVFSPGFFALVAFRLVIPHAKSRHSSDYIYLMPFVIFTLLLNFQSIISFAKKNKYYLDKGLTGKIFSTIDATDVWFTPILWIISVYNTLINYLVNVLNAKICEFPSFSISDYDIYTLVIDIQFRAFLATLALGIIIRFIFRVDDFYESFSYLYLNNEKLRYKILGFIGKNILNYNISSEISLSKQNPNQNNFFSKLAENINLILSNEWVNSLKYNKNIEILMLDIKTKDDHLYSGVFTNLFAGKDSELDSISMYNILCYYPENKSRSAKAKKEDSTLPISNRKWRLVKNQGEMYILSSEISTMNFWYLRKGVKLKQTYIYGEDYLFEKVKWYTILVYKYPKIVDGLHIDFCYEDDKDKNDFREKFNKWFEENGIEKSGRVKVSYYKKVSP